MDQMSAKSYHLERKPNLGTRPLDYYKIYIGKNERYKIINKSDQIISTSSRLKKFQLIVHSWNHGQSFHHP